MFSFSSLTHWIDQFLRNNMTDGWALFVEFVLIGIAIMVAYALLALFLIYIERRVCALVFSAVSAPTVSARGVYSNPAPT